MLPRSFIKVSENILFAANIPGHSGSCAAAICGKTKLNRRARVNGAVPSEVTRSVSAREIGIPGI